MKRSGHYFFSWHNQVVQSVPLSLLLFTIGVMSGCDKLHEDPIDVEGRPSAFRDDSSDDDDESDDSETSDETEQIMDADIDTNFSDSNDIDLDFNALSSIQRKNDPLLSTIAVQEQSFQVMISGGVYAVDQSGSVLGVLGEPFYNEAVLHTRFIKQSANHIDALLMSAFDSGLDSGLAPGTGTLWVSSHSDMYNLTNTPFFDPEPHPLGEVVTNANEISVAWPIHQQTTSPNAFMHLSSSGNAAVYSVKQGRLTIHMDESGASVLGEVELIGVKVMGDDMMNVAYKATFTGSMIK